ncbi:IclR family transcriptional regulator [Azoarcus sp. L1K30]|uniref:IclR family transcriptional regulator n=1 Tax=Azoarcus sp. L1K30 TaxID=2820277 RepID=UPI001B8390F0|nr:IclR family transcriptional regulator [Azoarcus sp. L1K30]MBR0564727.1 IclR family transcriptional regulator [Azoarcus sp. L1K30]
MAGSLISRALGALELLAEHPHGIALQDVADSLNLPKSAAHRLMASLAEYGYVRQDAASAHYMLTTRLLSVALGYLAGSGISDLVQPLMDRLAASTGELVRLSVIDGDPPDQRQVWVGKAQGAHQGLRYDPDMGKTAPLSCTATGFAWLACLSDEDALQLVSRQGIANGPDLGPNAPHTLKDVLKRLDEARKRGYALVIDSSQPGLAAIAVAVRHPQTKDVIGVLSVSGPSARLSEDRMRAIAPELQQTAIEMGQSHQSSSLFRTHSKT